MENILTDRAVKAAKPSEKPLTLRDGDGLFLLIQTKGQRLWRFRYTFNGCERLRGFGSYPQVSLEEARKRKKATRALIVDGVDPVEHKRAIKSAPKVKATDPTASFEFVARDWFKKNMSDLVPAHKDRVMRRFERDVFPWLGKRPINEIDAGELLAVLERIEERNAFETARRTLQTCSHIFSFAVLKKKAIVNIAADLRGALTKPKRKEQQRHHAAVTDPVRIGQLLRAIDGYTGSFVTRCALVVSPLFFVRPGELRHAKWADIDLDAAEWRYVSSKTKQPHVVPLANQALTILRELHPLSGNGKYVFPGARSDQRPMSENAVLAALRSLGYTKDEMTGHGFRAMARTVLDEVLGERVDLIEHQLAHAVKDANGRAYNRTSFLPQRHKMMQTWADYLDTLRKEKPRPASTAA
jgi:integrase